MSYNYLQVEPVRRYCEDIFLKHGFSETECQQIVDVIDGHDELPFLFPDLPLTRLSTAGG